MSFRRNEVLISGMSRLMRLHGPNDGVHQVIANDAHALNHRDHQKYSGATKMYLLPLYHAFIHLNIEEGCEFGKVALSNYHLIRDIDDILDGDKQLPNEEDPRTYIADLLQQIKTRTFHSDSPLSTLASYALKSLEERASKPSDDPQADMIKSIEWMIFDYDRTASRQLLTAAEVQTYYENSFYPIVDMMLIGLQSQLRAQDVPGLALSQPRVYSVRDLATDWQRGVINIPAETLTAADLTTDNTIEEIQNSKLIKRWAVDQAMRACDEAQATREVLATVRHERTTQLMCKALLKTVDGLVNQYLP